MRVRSVSISVGDVEGAGAFYRAAFGLAFEGGAASVGGLELRLVRGSGSGVELGLVVDDLEVAHARAVHAGARVVREPSEGAAVYLDPDGNVVSLSQGPSSLRVAGVDLASGALAVVVLEGDRVVEAFRCETFADALLVDAEVVAVDVPIGIPEDGGGPRAADVAARRFVGERAPSVFPTPIRAALEAPTYAEARVVSTRLTGKSLSAQSYSLGRRILELDELARRDERVIEVHPEVTFHELARRPLHSKRRLEGLVERRRILEEAGLEVPESAPRIAEPDLLDATAAAWTARRYARGEALPLPEGHVGRIGAIWR